MSPIVRYTLPKAHINCNFPCDLLYSTNEYTGLGLQNPYFVNYIQQIRTLVDNSPKLSITSKLFQSSFEVLRLEAGIAGMTRKLLHSLTTSARS